MKVIVAIVSIVALLWVAAAFAADPNYFEPAHRLVGVGVERPALASNKEMLRVRNEALLDVQTFAIMRQPKVLESADRVNTFRFHELLRIAAAQENFPLSTLEAIAFVESGGDEDARSPTGPRGPFQITVKTGVRLGLVKQMKVTKYVDRTVSRRVKGKIVKIKTRKKVSYLAVTYDARGDTGKSALAVARYLRGLEEKYGPDLALFAYHCGEGCTDELLAVVNKEGGDFKERPLTMARVFFLNSPVYHVRLYNYLRMRMAADYSPLYPFTIRRAETLLAIYRADRAQFQKLARLYRNKVSPEDRTPSRLWCWYDPADLRYKTCEDLEAADAKDLAPVPNFPQLLGFRLRTSGRQPIAELEPKRGPGHKEHLGLFCRDSPAAIGELEYIIFEARRLLTAMKVKKAPSYEVTALVRTEEYQTLLHRININSRTQFPTHVLGEMFDISAKSLSPKEREALEFILSDIQALGYLGYMVENRASLTYHIGYNPLHRSFFTDVFEDGEKALKGRRPEPVLMAKAEDPVAAVRSPKKVTVSRRHRRRRR